MAHVDAFSTRAALELDHVFRVAATFPRGRAHQRQGLAFSRRVGIEQVSTDAIDGRDAGFEGPPQRSTRCRIDNDSPGQDRGLEEGTKVAGRCLAA
jgi:hypothetical protein